MAYTPKPKVKEEGWIEDAREILEGTQEEPQKETQIVLEPVLTKEQMGVLDQPTPKKYIKQRKGRGDKYFSYVEVGYVITKLNEIFGHYWDWEIEAEQVGRGHVWVKGKLTVKSLSHPELKITKSAYGGSAIKTTQSGDVIDIGDDLKAASSDALKKAASMLGIASDVYFPNMDRLDD